MFEVMKKVPSFREKRIKFLDNLRKQILNYVTNQIRHFNFQQ